MKRRTFAINTLKHIHRVHFWGVWLVENFKHELDLTDVLAAEFIASIAKHDQSKFTFEQFNAYYNMFRSPYGMEDQETIEKFNDAKELHYKAETHHPEGFPYGRIQSRLIAYEIACDLQAMSDMRNQGSCRKYFEETWCKEKYKYVTDDYEWARLQAEINRCIVCFERRIDRSKIKKIYHCLFGEKY